MITQSRIDGVLRHDGTYKCFSTYINCGLKGLNHALALCMYHRRIMYDGRNAIVIVSILVTGRQLEPMLVGRGSRRKTAHFKMELVCHLGRVVIFRFLGWRQYVIA
jgi:hypothetical protein